jgi:molybdopterin synthase catalytic subunit
VFKIVSDPIEKYLDDVNLREDSLGAVITFEGRVRDENNGRTVTRLDYEAYDELASNEAETIFEELRNRFDIENIAAFHRVGQLEPGELAFWVGVSTGHRDPAFKGCRYVVDEIKRRIPVWKKEHYADGTSKRINTSNVNETG